MPLISNDRIGRTVVVIGWILAIGGVALAIVAAVLLVVAAAQG